jgi:hypothetical protein
MQITKEYIITHNAKTKEFVIRDIINKEEIIKLNAPSYDSMNLRSFKINKDMSKVIVYTDLIGLYLLTDKSS